MDLFKAYNCLQHDLIIAKLETYGLDTNSQKDLFLITSAAENKTKMGSTYSNWSEVLLGISQ